MGNAFLVVFRLIYFPLFVHTTLGVNRLKFFKIALFAVLSVAAAGVFVLRPAAPTEPAPTVREQTEENSTFNILLLGCDESGVRPDTIMLAHVVGGEGKVRLLSLPRDIKLRYKNRNRKLNTVMALDGLSALQTKVEELTGIEVDYYVSLKTGVFAKIVDALGGLEYYVERDMHYSDPAQSLYIDLQAGEQLLSGEQCEQYCRYRSYAMGDLTRTQNQQRLLGELMRQKVRPEYIVKLPALYNIIKENAETDITAADISRYLPLARSMAQGELDINSFDCPGEYNDMQAEGASYYLIDEAELRELCASEFAK